MGVATPADHPGWGRPSHQPTPTPEPSSNRRIHVPPSSSALGGHRARRLAASPGGPQLPSSRRDQTYHNTLLYILYKYENSRLQYRGIGPRITRLGVRPCIIVLLDGTVRIGGVKYRIGVCTAITDRGHALPG